MSGKDNSDRKALILLADAFVEDILNMSDEEILREFQEEGGDPERNREEVLKHLERAALSANKSRMVAAKAGASARTRASHRTSRKIVDITLARARLRSIIERSQSDSKVTLAARNEDELSDEDVLSILEDLEELDSMSPGNEDRED